MPKVNEAVIDTVLQEVDDHLELYDQSLEQLQQEQPMLAAYLFSESFEPLTEAEQDFFLYLAIVIWRSISKVYPNQEPITEEKIGEAEEKNWEILSEQKEASFQKRIDAFFEDPDQEDLLALIEDALVVEQDEMEELGLTKEGREPIFIGLKTMVDCLLPQF